MKIGDLILDLLSVPENVVTDDLDPLMLLEELIKTGVMNETILNVFLIEKADHQPPSLIHFFGLFYDIVYCRPAGFLPKYTDLFRNVFKETGLRTKLEKITMVGPDFWNPCGLLLANIFTFQQ